VTQFPVDVGEGRSLPNVLKRISSLLALKSTVSIKIRVSMFRNTLILYDTGMETVPCK
jgi:hypothetical protein